MTTNKFYPSFFTDIRELESLLKKVAYQIECGNTDTAKILINHCLEQINESKNPSWGNGI